MNLQNFMNGQRDKRIVNNEDYQQKHYRNYIRNKDQSINNYLKFITTVKCMTNQQSCRDKQYRYCQHIFRNCMVLKQ